MDNKAKPHLTGVRHMMTNKEIDEILRAKFGRKLGAFKHLPGL